MAPRIETDVPADPVCGEKLAMVGATVKLELLAVALTLKGPLVAPMGTTANI